MVAPDKNLNGDPIGKAEFARLMAALGPYEERPRIAVACSGGPDSLALALLVHDWAEGCGGAATALIVDHGMRTASAAEAAQAARLLSIRDVASRILRRRGGRPARGVQVVARTARFALLTRWCAENDHLHLALAHHREDQAETVLLRLARGSGVDGLAAMAAIAETPSVRLLRPLLNIRVRGCMRRYRGAGSTRSSTRRTVTLPLRAFGCGTWPRFSRRKG